MYHVLSSEPPPWSSAAQGLAALVCAQATLAVAILAQGPPATVTAAIAAGGAVVTVLLVVRTRMPDAAKALFGGALAVTTLTMVVGADLLGLRAVGHAVADARPETGTVLPVATGPTDAAIPHAAPLTIRVEGGATASMVTDAVLSAVALRRPAAPDGPHIDGRISGDATGFAMRWGITRGAQRLSCGDLRVSGLRRDLAVTAFSDALVSALDASAMGGLACHR